MEKLQIEENVAPEDVVAKASAGRGPKWDWSQMRTGPYPAVFDTEDEGKKALASARRYGKDHGWKFKGRVCLDGKFRIWRVL